MKIITISREFGSGGREIGKRLSDILGFDYYDREIITTIAENKGMDERYVEKVLDNQILKAIPITFRNSFSIPTVTNNAQTKLLLEQRKVIEKIAKAGKDCVIVGCNADVILEEYNPFSIFVCADMETKIKRCMERASENEKLSKKQIETNIKRIDKNRESNREVICSFKWGDPHNYDLTVNTTYWNIKELSLSISEVAMRWFGGQHENTLI